MHCGSIRFVHFLLHAAFAIKFGFFPFILAERLLGTHGRGHLLKILITNLLELGLCDHLFFLPRLKQDTYSKVVVEHVVSVCNRIVVVLDLPITFLVHLILHLQVPQMLLPISPLDFLATRRLGINRFLDLP